MFNPLKADPSRTATLRRQFEEDLRKRFNRIARAVRRLVDTEDSFGLRRTARAQYAGVTGSFTIRPLNSAVVENARWQFLTSPQQINHFGVWLQQQYETEILSSTTKFAEDTYWEKYVQEGYKKGAGRAFDDVKKPALLAGSQSQLDFYEGTKAEFLRSSFGRPETIAKVKLLAGRVYTELKNVTEDMSARLSRSLADGLVQGANPMTIGKTLVKDIGFSETRAERIARTEIIRAHAEGALDSMEALGVQKIGVMVEWSTAGDDRVCPLCAALEGAVFTIKEAHGMIPRHPNCRCAPIPANVGESTKEQIRGKIALDEAVDKSLLLQKPEGVSLAEFKEQVGWAGARKNVAIRRPNPRVDAADKSALAKVNPSPKKKGGPPVPEAPKFTPEGLPLREHITIESDLPGSTGPKLVSDSKGKKWVMKEGLDAGHVRSEALADDLYRALGAKVPKSGIVETANGPVKFSEYLEGGEPLGKFLKTASAQAEKEVLDELSNHFVADALLGNRDVVGLSLDNVSVVNGVPYRIDNGGALFYRAQGALKSDFGRAVGELTSLRNPAINSQTASVFKDITEQQIAKQIKLIQKKADDLLALVTDEKLKKVLAERIDWLGSQVKGHKQLNKEFVNLVKKSRLNGRVFEVDREDIEDLGLLVWEEVDAAGKTITRVSGKLTDSGAEKLQAAMGKNYPTTSVVAGDATVHPLDEFWDHVLQAAKTINTHAADGAYNMGTIANLEKKVVAPIKDTLKNVKTLTPDEMALYKYYDELSDKLIKATIDHTSVPIVERYKMPKKPSAASTLPEGRLPAPKVNKNKVRLLEIEKGHARRVAYDVNEFDGTNLTIDLDGVEVKFYPTASKATTSEKRLSEGRRAGKAFDNTFEFTIPEETSVEGLEKVRKILDTIGIDSKEPSEVYEELAYLRRSVRAMKQDQAYDYTKIVNNVNSSDEEKITQIKAWLKKDFNLNPENSKWYNPKGIPMSEQYGDGTRFWYRWDIDPEDVEAAMGDYTLYHANWNGGIDEALEKMLDSGGQFACSAQRIRRGIPVGSKGGATGGGSVESDIMSGGADYVFTRIDTKASAATRQGIQFRIRNLSRQDLVSYDGDRYGSTSDLAYRAVDVDGWKRNASQGGNEANFKHGLSILDELEKVVCRDEAQKKRVLDIFKKAKVTKIRGTDVKDMVVVAK